MANINLRLYGEQIYPTISKYLTNYISPEIKKEDFLEMYKKGQLELNQMTIKEKIKFHPQILIENGSFNSIKFHIPNETENFSIFLNDMKCSLIMSDIKEDEIELILIEDQKNLINEFMKYAIAKIEKKDGASFFDNILKNFIDKIINGITIEINNLELKLTIDNGKNKSFIFLIENLYYSEEKGIKIKNISLLYEEEMNKINVIDKFDFNIDIIHSNGEGQLNRININITDFKFELNENIYYEFINYYNLLDNAEYKKIYIKYKKLIQFHSPKSIEGKKDYKSLWYYAIKTVIKLQKYIKYNKENIFDILEITQMKIAKKYLEDEKIDEMFLLPNIKEYLMATRGKVEKKVLDDKKGNVLANAFNFFFGAKKEEKPEELTEEEKGLSDEIYKELNVLNYIKGNIKSNQNANLSSIIDKVKKFLSNVSIDLSFIKLELILINNDIGKKKTLFIKGIGINLNYNNDEFDLKFVLNDIGYEKDKSFFVKMIDDLNKNAIELRRDKNNFINLIFGFNNILFKEEFFLSFINSFKIKGNQEQKLFHEKKYNYKIEEKEGKEKENKIIQNIQNFSFQNNFKISHIPSFSIKTIDNKYDVIITNYSLSNNSFSFTMNINDLYGILIKDFTFNPRKEDNEFIFKLDSPISISLSNKSLKSLFINYLRYKNYILRKKYKNGNIAQNINNNDKNDGLLFGFNYTSYKNIELSAIGMNNYVLNMNIKKLNIQIEEEDNFHSTLAIDNFNLLYKQKNFGTVLDKFVITTNINSNIILYLFRKKKGFPFMEEYQKVNKDGYIPLLKENENNNIKDSDNKLKITNKLDNEKVFNENFNEINFQIKIFGLIIYSNKLIMTLSLNSVKFVKMKEKNDIFGLCNKWSFEINSEKTNYKNKKIVDVIKVTKFKYNINSNFIKGDTKSIYLTTNLVEITHIWDHISFLFHNDDDNKLKIDLSLDDIVLSSDKFIYSISKMFIKNYIKDIIIKNIYYFKIFEFEMRNNNNIKLIYEKELDLDYIFKIKTEDNIDIRCIQDINVQISQSDISYMLLNYRIPESVKEDDFKRFQTGDLKMTNNYAFNSRGDTDTIKTKNSMEEFQSDIKKLYLIAVNVNVPKLNLSFCLNDNYKKISEFVIQSSKIKINYIKNENMIDSKRWWDMNYSLFLNNLYFKYFYLENKNEFNILTKRKININENIKNNKLNQVEIFFDNNKYIVNINQNHVNVRMDSLFSLFYYFKGSLPIDEIINNLEKMNYMNKNKNHTNLKNKKLSYKINFFESKFQLSTSLDSTENLFLDINRFIIEYDSYDNGELPFGNYSINLNQLYTEISSNNKIRKLFYTENDFLSVQINYSEEIFSSNINMSILKINLSYRELISFYRAYLINMKMIDSANKKKEYYLKNLELIKIKKENLKNDKNNIVKDKNILNYLSKNNNTISTGELHFKILDITLIDDSKKSYHPFMNIINENIKLILNPDKSLETSFSLILYSYNYIACVWEPTIEKIDIKYDETLKKEKDKKLNKKAITLDKLLINLSDMAISFTLLTFNNWIKKLEEKKKKLELEEEIFSNNIQLKNEGTKKFSRITNNQLINYTGVEMLIVHNGKKIRISPLKRIELDYISESNHSKHILLIYDKNHKFEIPSDKIVTLRHIINNNLSIISENSLSENRTIIISLYSPVIFKNKSIFPLQIKIKNFNFGNTFIDLYPNSIVGLPLHLVNEDTFFIYKLINNKNDDKDENYSSNFSLNSILNNNINSLYKKEIKFTNKTLMMKLDNKIKNVRTLIINTQYSIVNCLPCEINILFQNKKIILKKCSQYYIDNNNDSKFAFIINTDYGKFTTKIIEFLSLKESNEDNSIKFTNKESGKYFKLLFNFKQNEEENSLIIYSELILYNKSGINLSYNFERDNNLLCFEVCKNINLISSKIDFKEKNIKILYDSYISEEIAISKLIEASFHLNINLKNNENKYIYLSVKKKFSYITIFNNPNFKENIRSMVFSILNSCRIVNLLSTKRFVVFDYENQKNYLIVPPLDKRGFQFFCKGSDALLGISVINLNSNKYSLIKFKFKNGIYTLTTDDDYTFNLEIRKNPSNGCIDVFVIENNINNSQILLENLTNQGICIYQKDFEKFTQILSSGEKQSLKIYDYYNKDFIIQTPKSAKLIKLNNIEENVKRIDLEENIMLLIEANGKKVKATFYIIEEYKKIKSKLLYNDYIIYINKIYISLISDNEYPDTKLINYKRNELLLFFLSGFSLFLNIESAKGILDKDFIDSKFLLNKFEIYNQISERGKFSCLFKAKSLPFFDMENEINFFEKLKIAKIEKQNIRIGEIELGIDPQFVNEIFKFFDNILYRMNITNFNVHKIFLENKVIDPEKMIKKYNNANILINSSQLLYPEINIDFELSKIGLKKLLKERLGCSDFYIWIAKGLIGHKENLTLEKSILTLKNFGIKQYFMWLYYIYLQKIESHITNIGYKGIFGKFKNIITLDILFEDDTDDEVKRNRKRMPRAFFGKFKYFKEFNEEDAFIIKKLFVTNKILSEKYYPIRIIKGKKEFYFFTTLSMFCSDYSSYQLRWNIDYFLIKNAEAINLRVKVNYNQPIESKTSCCFECENENIAKNVAKSLNEETINNKENILEI